ncbi:TPA: pyridoxal-phosphate dependent enzyme [Legionella pneumophila subsp. raphaeli]|uniref:pyridoxal-phosphate dependent enzyme n=1 Tax=Legionella pneumophila TaxID=446 RepID=UPI0007899FE1|nr:pyridoxal-phosphate dependent enzyme [Legionella pneumophila]HCO4737881.1 pyridoxal-phosphate dependent enzyme [Legionella pneumophila]HDU7928379.1 pyridoxal-phosphate dependent enzyme [Legionella pneumophila]HDU7934510.1 pyridoxal-phosphate dependent enzyme [Legionella pneumophila]HDU7963866.1 pyridoxal-phosphate dependent enzyme [Legionella pneumophila]HEG4428357.1 pyridoxal-phosphate dependent enzyme [Legionella pneumophila]
MWNLSSRVHTLNHFPKQGVECYVKRDDELGCGISGTKIRKYSSLMPFLKIKGIRHLIIIAGAQSNNLLAALQVARECQLKVTAFLIKPKHLKIQGNFKLSLLFLHENEIIWVNREEWHRVNEFAEQYLKGLRETGYILYEGANVPESMKGAMSLANDIKENERILGFAFDHIFIDAGTGFSAIALIKGFNELQHKGIIHVLLLADSEGVFKKKLMHWSEVNPDNYNCFYPTTAKSFGSVNQTIKKEIKRLAYEEGILADPIYSAKLFYESRKYIEKYQLKGKVLIIHSGGILTMPGFDF